MPEPRRDDRVRMAVFFVGVLVLASILMLRQPVFFVFMISGFFYASYLRPLPLAVVGVGATSILVNSLIIGLPQTTEAWTFYLVIISVQTVVIGAGVYVGERITEQNEERRQALARLEAATIENAGLHAQLLTQAREAGVLDERQRMAREIHDTIAQGLIGIVTQLEAADQARDRPADRDRHLDNAERLARESLTEARRSVEASMPAALEAGTLPDAIADVAREWSEMNTVPVAVAVTGEVVALHPGDRGGAPADRPGGAGQRRPPCRRRARLAHAVLHGRRRDPRRPRRRDGLPRRRARVRGWRRVRAERDAPAGGPRRRLARDRIGAGRRDGRVGPRPGDRGRDRVGRRRAVSPIRLLIVDDHPVVRDGLRGMLAGDPDLEVVGEAADGAEALALVASLQPDVVLMDLRMPGMGGAAAIRQLAEQGAEARVLVLTTYDSDSDVVPALEAGATGYLLKDAPREQLVRAIRAAARDEAVLAPSVATRLVSQLRAPAQDALSERELEVLTLIAQGETNRGAAARLFISEATVKTHLLHIYAKLDVNDRAAAVAAGYERGLLVPHRT